MLETLVLAFKTRKSLSVFWRRGDPRGGETNWLFGWTSFGISKNFVKKQFFVARGNRLNFLPRQRSGPWHTIGSHSAARNGRCKIPETSLVKILSLFLDLCEKNLVSKDLYISEMTGRKCLVIMENDPGTLLWKTLDIFVVEPKSGMEEACIKNLFGKFALGVWPSILLSTFLPGPSKTNQAEDPSTPAGNLERQLLHARPFFLLSWQGIVFWSLSCNNHAGFVLRCHWFLVLFGIKYICLFRGVE